MVVVVVVVMVVVVVVVCEPSSGPDFIFELLCREQGFLDQALSA